MKSLLFIAILLLVYMVGAFVFNALTFLFSYYESQSTRRESGRWKPHWPQANGGWLRAAIREFPITAVDLIWLPFGWIDRDEKVNRRRGNDHAPLIFVHGWSQNRITFAWIICKFKNRLNGRKLFTLNLPTTRKPLAELADHLAKRIDEVVRQTGHSKVTLVGHSLGGLVSREYMAQYGQERVEALVTLATPHGGSKLSFPDLAFVGGSIMREMEPGSETLQKLDRQRPQGLKIVCVGSVHDNFVLPFDSSFMPGADEIVLSGVGHNGLLFDARVLDIIENSLENRKPEDFQAPSTERDPKPETENESAAAADKAAPRKKSAGKRRVKSATEKKQD